MQNKVHFLVCTLRYIKFLSTILKLLKFVFSFEEMSLKKIVPRKVLFKNAKEPQTFSCYFFFWGKSDCLSFTTVALDFERIFSFALKLANFCVQTISKRRWSLCLYEENKTWLRRVVFRGIYSEVEGVKHDGPVFLLNCFQYFWWRVLRTFCSKQIFQHSQIVS